MLVSALTLAAEGMAVFPCRPDKRPASPQGFKDATTDPFKLRRLFSIPGVTLIGMPTGILNGLDAVDIDPRHGGFDWLKLNDQRLPSTRVHGTRSGGWHFLFRHHRGTRNSVGRIALGVDVRAEGGYIIVPPSPGYSIAENRPLAPWPIWLLKVAMPRRSEGPIKVRRIPPGPTGQPLDTGSGTPYGMAALQAECLAITHAIDGSKHHTVNRSGWAIGGLVSAGHLDTGFAWTALRQALNAIAGNCRDFQAAVRTLERSFSDGTAVPRHVARKSERSGDIQTSHNPRNLRQRELAKAALKLLRQGVSPADLSTILLSSNASHQDPLTVHTVHRVAAWAATLYRSRRNG
jgi:hypothetical protein